LAIHLPEPETVGVSRESLSFYIKRERLTAVVQEKTLEKILLIVAQGFFLRNHSFLFVMKSDLTIKQQCQNLLKFAYSNKKALPKKFFRKGFLLYFGLFFN